jgi:hypothetical protein
MNKELINNKIDEIRQGLILEPMEDENGLYIEVGYLEYDGVYRFISNIEIYEN